MPSPTLRRSERTIAKIPPIRRISPKFRLEFYARDEASHPKTVHNLLI